MNLAELDRTTLPAFLEGIRAADAAPALAPPRSYPGYPRWPLPRLQPRRLASLDRALWRRRSPDSLGASPPGARTLGRLLRMAHGISGDHHRGPTPSAGGLQALELYVAAWTGGWLPAGLYHYDRAGHHLSQLEAGCLRSEWQELVPALTPVTAAPCCGCWSALRRP